MILENVTVQVYSMRPKDGDEYPTTVRIKTKSAKGYTTDIMASMRFHKREKKGYSFKAKSVTLSLYKAKHGKLKGKMMKSVDSIVE